jgi:hypothetical protein
MRVVVVLGFSLGVEADFVEVDLGIAFDTFWGLETLGGVERQTISGEGDLRGRPRRGGGVGSSSESQRSMGSTAVPVVKGAGGVLVLDFLGDGPAVRREIDCVGVVQRLNAELDTSERERLSCSTSCRAAG